MYLRNVAGYALGGGISNCALCIELRIINVGAESEPPKGVSTLSWWWGLCDSVTRRAMPAVA
jgi:hypothetical protein